MERYMNVEFAAMHLAYEAVDYNGRAAQWLYALSYSTRKTPSHAIFSCYHHRLSKCLFFIRDLQKRQRRIRTPSDEETVLDYI
ncbi:DUF4817 domain-containing protein [Trichonephila clavipes]|nr:DUF4817 domain-containing protein [Trichonephila clavipes]